MSRNYTENSRLRDNKKYRRPKQSSPIPGDLRALQMQTFMLRAQYFLISCCVLSALLGSVDGQSATSTQTFAFDDIKDLTPGKATLEEAEYKGANVCA